MFFLNHFHKIEGFKTNRDLVYFSCFPLLISITLNGRRGEEHSFILKPATSAWKLLKAQGQSSQSSHLPVEGKRSPLTSDQYAVLVSCRCNYTGKYTCSWSTLLSVSLQEFVVYACHIFILRFIC